MQVAVDSALRQTVAEIEVFIVGDGLTPDTRQAALALKDTDARVRLFENPKGARHGELHRHEALRHASGDIVCYLSDDDVWLPDHVANALVMLSSADFAHSLPTEVRVDGSLGIWTVDLMLEHYRAMLLGGENAIPLTTAAHTLSLYRRLPHGWRTTPTGTPTDLYMWQQILEADAVTSVSGTVPTALSFPARTRQDMSADERLVEVRKWAKLSQSPGWSSDLQSEVLDLTIRERAARQANRQIEVDGLATALASATEGERRASQEVTDLTGLNETLANAHQEDLRDIEALRLDMNRVAQDLDDAENELGAVYASNTWRLHNAVVRMPVLARFLRWLARALAPRS